jgi:hypothetical protein
LVSHEFNTVLLLTPKRYEANVLLQHFQSSNGSLLGYYAMYGAEAAAT